MKKFFVLLLAVLVFLVVALGFYAPLRETVRPYLPLVVQQFLPAAKNAGAADVNATGTTAKTAADAAAPRSGGKGAAIAVSIANESNWCAAIIAQSCEFYCWSLANLPVS